MRHSYSIGFLDMSSVISGTRLFLLVLLLFIGGLTQSASAATPPVNAGLATTEKPSRGLEAAKALSILTGVAISPLLGVAVVGAWDYVHASEVQRLQLPWFAHPGFWVPALLLVLLVGVKDLFGAMLPPGWKKPFDVAEAIENKVSGLVATGAFVPIIASIFSALAVPSPASGPSAAWLCQTGGFAIADFSWLGNWLTVPLAIVAFLLVWLVSHTINILILISPWGAVDAALKTARLALMSSIAVAALANPYLGAGLSLVVIVIAYFLAGWSFRLLVFGSVFTWDFLTFRRARTRPHADRIDAFTARAIGNAPIRSYGKLVRTESGSLRLEYRPWIVLPKRVLPIPEARYEIGRALVCPELVAVDPSKDIRQSLLSFPPRFRGHESRLAEVLFISDVHEVGLLRGFNAVWMRLKNLVGLRTSEAASVTALR